jgi:amino acid transporter
MTEGKDPEADSNLERSLGVPGLTALGVGAMIGAGVFVLTGMAAGRAGPALVVVFLFNGAIAMIVGACYAELATMMPRTGGAYIWAKPGLGPFYGFFAGWMSFFAQLIACSLYAAAFGTFAGELLAEITDTPPPAATARAATVGILLALLGFNIRGTGQTGRLEVLITGLKIVILLIVIILGLRLVLGKTEPTAAFSPFAPNGYAGIIAAMGITFVAFEGYEIIVQAGEEARDPGRTLPRAIFASILISVAAYVLVAVVMLGAVEAPAGRTVHGFLGELGELGLMRAAGQFVPYGKIVLLIAGLASTASALNATIYGSSRIVFAMARDGDLPATLDEVHAERRTPHLAIAAIGLPMVVMAVLLPIEDIAAGTNIMFLLVFVMVCATLIRLRNRWPDRERPFRVPLSPWLPALGILAGIVLSAWLLDVSRLAWLVAGGWLLLGGVIYLLRRSAETDEG